uniref:Uncharacterized protein n=1 Tax=Acrobeloides nanus TaxID=290746 RepID=A0A914CUH8_9BILA
MNLQEIFTMLQLTDEEFDDWLISMGLLHGSQFCDNCGNRIALDRRRWICHKDPRRQHSRPKKGVYVGTFFEET